MDIYTVITYTGHKQIVAIHDNKQRAEADASVRNRIADENNDRRRYYVETIYDVEVNLYE